MDKDTILKLAEEAGLYIEGSMVFAKNGHTNLLPSLQKFASLIEDSKLKLVIGDNGSCGIVEQNGSGEAVTTLTAERFAQLIEIEHHVWHLLGEMPDDAFDGAEYDYDALCTLLGNNHPDISQVELAHGVMHKVLMTTIKPQLPNIERFTEIVAKALPVIDQRMPDVVQSVAQKILSELKGEKA